MSRRKTLALIGGGAVLAAGGGAGYAVTRQPHAALAPWTAAGRYDDPRLRALSHAILAPNPHNRQPWKVDVATPGRVTLFVDTDRLLPHTDPFSRQIVIGLGCFLEIMRMAALNDGLDVQMALFPDGMPADRLDARPIAVCDFFDTDAAPDPLFAQVPHRRSLKEPFDTARPVPQDAIARIRAAVRHGTVTGATADPGEVAALRALSVEAMLVELRTERTYKESVDLFRIGHREVNANPDGIDFSGPMFEAMHLTGLFSRSAAMDRAGMAYSQGEAAVLENMQTAMAHIWQVSAGNTRADQIAAGRDWVRLNLAATAEGLGVQPLSQALQEYPEMAPFYKTAHDMLAPDGGTVQMWARLGYGPAVPQSPRWPLEDKIA
ncbi:MAG: twin-arginine translocation pathway signal protein [Rhodobacteraceae bacterium]|nr:twin-arginine translocation pathway signal protein [Paracoccaceae bacterium]